MAITLMPRPCSADRQLAVEATGDRAHLGLRLGDTSTRGRSRPRTNHPPAPSWTRRVSQSGKSVCGSHTSAPKPDCMEAGMMPTISDAVRRASSDAPIAAGDPPKRALPEAMADHGEALTIGGLLQRKGPAEHGLDTEEREEIRRDPVDADLLALIAAGQYRRRPGRTPRCRRSSRSAVRHSSTFP